jgi:hypothetical protein
MMAMTMPAAAIGQTVRSISPSDKAQGAKAHTELLK